jgi:Transglutaminase-like superfamily
VSGKFDDCGAHFFPLNLRKSATIKLQWIRRAVKGELGAMTERAVLDRKLSDVGIMARICPQDNVLARAMRVPLRRKVLFAEALVNTVLAWFMVRFLPYRVWKRNLGRIDAVMNHRPLSSSDISHARQIGWAVTRVNQFGNERFTCLMVAMAGKWMLNRRGTPNVLVLGAKVWRDSEESQNVNAHAWLNVELMNIVGGEIKADYVVIASFHGP